MPSNVPAMRIMILSRGGLISIIDMAKERAITSWPEELSLSGMALVALLLRFLYEYRENVITFDKILEKSNDDLISLFYDQGYKLINSPMWVAYVSENSEYIAIAEYNKKTNTPIVINLLKYITDHLEDLPEDSLLISDATMKLISEYSRSIEE